MREVGSSQFAADGKQTHTETGLVLEAERRDLDEFGYPGNDSVKMATVPHDASHFRQFWETL